MGCYTAQTVLRDNMLSEYPMWDISTPSHMSVTRTMTKIPTAAQKYGSMLATWLQQRRALIFSYAHAAAAKPYC